MAEGRKREREHTRLNAVKTFSPVAREKNLPIYISRSHKDASSQCCSTHNLDFSEPPHTLHEELQAFEKLYFNPKLDLYQTVHCKPYRTVKKDQIKNTDKFADLLTDKKGLLTPKVLSGNEKVTTRRRLQLVSRYMLCASKLNSEGGSQQDGPKKSANMWISLITHGTHWSGPAFRPL